MVDNRIATRKDFKNFRPHQDVELKGSLQYVSGAEVLSIDGRDVFLGGAVEYWPTRAHLWSFPSADLNKKDWISIVRYLLRRIEEKNYARLEATVVVGFEEGYRLLWALGFKHEHVLKRYYQDESDAILFVRYGDVR